MARSANALVLEVVRNSVFDTDAYDAHVSLTIEGLAITPTLCRVQNDVDYGSK